MANYSDVDITNMALAMLGANTIRSMDEDNKRARLANIFYPMMRDYLLARFDWPFARKLAALKMQEGISVIQFYRQLDSKVPDGWYPYGLPSDCLAPRDLEPFGSREKWMVIKNAILLRVPPETEPKLWYTAAITAPSDFSMQFVHLLALGLAVKLAPAIAANQELTAGLTNQWMAEQAIGFGDDANIGEIPDPDNNPRLDTFSEPDMAYYNAIRPFGAVEYNNTDND